MSFIPSCCHLGIIAASARTGLNNSFVFYLTLLTRNTCLLVVNTCTARQYLTLVLNEKNKRRILLMKYIEST